MAPTQGNQYRDRARSPEVTSPRRGQGKMVRKVRAKGKVHFMTISLVVGQWRRGGFETRAYRFSSLIPPSRFGR